MLNAIQAIKNQLKIQLFNYFQKTKSYSSIRFIIEIVLLIFLLKIAVALFFATIIEDDIISNTEKSAQDGFIYFLVSGVILAPIIETLIGQWLPIQVASLFFHRPAILICISAFFFSFLHVSDDLAGLVGFFAVLPGAVLLAWSFIIKRKESFWHAYWITTAIHGLHNLIALCIYLITKHYNLR